jgi:hypothetical protein
MVQPMPESTIKIRPLTVVFMILAVLLIAGGIYYFITPAHNLASFVPGHEAHGTNHHIKHGIALIGLAVLALIGAWFTTAPDKSAGSH